MQLMGMEIMGNYNSGDLALAEGTKDNPYIIMQKLTSFFTYSLTCTSLLTSWAKFKLQECILKQQ